MLQTVNVVGLFLQLSVVLATVVTEALLAFSVSVVRHGFGFGSMVAVGDAVWFLVARDRARLGVQLARRGAFD